jgi:cell division protein FtsW
VGTTPVDSRPSTPAARAATARTTTARTATGREGSAFSAALDRLDSPLTSYYLVTGASVALLGIGLVMVLSSSSVTSLADNGSAFSVFTRQVIFALIGLPLMLVATRVPIRTWKVMAYPLLVFAILFQLLVFTSLGVEVKGNLNWIKVAGFTMQPAEVGKLALSIWAAAVLARKRPLVHQPMHALVPVVPGAAILLLLVLQGNDLGTTLVLLAVVGATLFVAGAPMRIFMAGLVAASFLVLLLVKTSDNRMGRIDTWLKGGNCSAEEILNACNQTSHGMYALATGGWWGVGLGASRQKWGLLPEAHNDFIFAVLGEELGLVGTLTVLALFAALAMGLFRIVLRTDDLFVKIATGGVLTWIVGQAVINIGAVIGLLPVVGVPLPLVSSGGSALVMAMIGLGMVIGFARREPGAREALAARAGLVQRSLAVLPVRQEARRAREATAAGKGARDGGALP